MSKPVSLALQERALKSLSENGAFKFTNTFFPYTSGQIGPYYAQSGDVMARGSDFKTAIEDVSDAVKIIYKGKVPSDLVIAGGETRDWIFSLTAGANLSLPTTMLYKDGKTVGANIRDKQVLLICDLNNEGSSPRDYWVPLIRKQGGKIDRVLFYVDRMEDGVNEIQKLGLDSYAIAPLDQNAWNFLSTLPNSGVTPQIHRNLVKRMEDKDSWARNMLLSESGIKQLAALIEFEGTRNKGLKILNVGYPYMKKELVNMLEHSFPMAGALAR